MSRLCARPWCATSRCSKPKVSSRPSRRRSRGRGANFTGANGPGSNQGGSMSLLHPDRLFSANPIERDIARNLFESVSHLPIVSPHGHTDPRWYARNENFANPAELLVVPDHYVFRMLFSQGVRLEDLGIATLSGEPVETDPRAIWRRFAEHYHLFAGTPTRMWLDHTF